MIASFVSYFIDASNVKVFAVRKEASMNKTRKKPIVKDVYKRPKFEEIAFDYTDVIATSGSCHGYDCEDHSKCTGYVPVLQV